MRDFRILWVGQTLNELGTKVSAFAFPLLTYALTGSITWAAIVEGAYLLGLVATLLPAGVLADRLDRGRIMRGSAWLGAIAYAAAGTAAVLGALTLPHLLATALVSGVAAGLLGPAETAALRAIVPDEELPRALSLTQGRQHVASLVGGPLGGVLYGLARSLPLLADAVSYVVSAVLLRGIRADLAAPEREHASALAELRIGVRYLAGHPLFRVLTGWAFLANLTMNLLFHLAVLRMVGDGVAPLRIGLVETAAAVAGIVGALLATRVIQRVPTGWLTIGVAWSAVPLAVPMAFWPHPGVVAAALASVVLLNPAGNAGMASYRLAVTPPEMIGRLQSATQVVALLPLPAAPVLAGVLLHTLGGRTSVLIAAAGCGLSALVPTLSRTIRAVPRPDRWLPDRSGEDAVEDLQGAGPGRGGGVDDDEVVAVDAHELGTGAGGGGRAHVGLGLADGHDGVLVAVDAPDGHVEGHHADRVDVVVGRAVGVSEERRDGAVTEVLR